jgi:hypothetical protein
MPSKFRRGAVAFTDNGRRYTIEEVEDGTVYCVGDNGAETEFSEAALLTEAEWTARTDKRNGNGNIYGRLKQARAFTTPSGRLDRAASTAVVTRIEKLSPGILDFTAFVTAGRALAEFGEASAAAELSISKCRTVFDEASPEVRASLLASLLTTAPDMLVNASKLGDNLLRALIDKGMAARATEFDEFCDRPRS